MPHVCYHQGGGKASQKGDIINFSVSAVDDRKIADGIERYINIPGIFPVM